MDSRQTNNAKQSDRRLRQLFIFASGLSSFGSSMAWIATTFIIFQQTHSVLATSLPSVSFFVPAVALGPLSTRLSSRFGATQLFVVSEVIVAFVTLVPVMTALLGHLAMTTLLVWEFAQGSAIGLQGPSKNIVIRILAPKGEVPEYNGKILRAVAVSAVLGFLVGGLLLDAFGPIWTFSIDALSSFVLAAVVVPKFRNHHHNEKPETIARAFPVLKTNPGLRSVFLMFAVVTLVGSIVVLFPSIADHAGKGASGISVLNMSFVFGGLFIVGSVRFLHQRVRWNSVIWISTTMTILFLLFLLVVNYVITSHSLSLLLIVLVLLPLGFLVSLQTSILTALVQIGSPKDSQSSVIELFTLLPMVIIPLSEALVGLLADQFSVSLAVAIIGVTLLIVYVWGIKTHQKESLGEMDQQQVVTPLPLLFSLRGAVRSRHGGTDAQHGRMGTATDEKGKCEQ